MSFEIGDRVVLASGKHMSSPRNPGQGTAYACEGSIIRTMMGGRGQICTVNWDNGNENAYWEFDLLPSLSGRIEFTNCKKCNTAVEKIKRADVAYECPNCLSLFTKYGVMLEG